MNFIPFDFIKRAVNMSPYVEKSGFTELSSYWSEYDSKKCYLCHLSFYVTPISELHIISSLNDLDSILKARKG
ncbi:hypothetical protein L596_030642 [Steinernema carpocapsae]|uniref:Uncharacterized protein n=1 Tax=Steinernema carpocapsae TaxID=34508 RepID=A0A4U5LQ06_STECR|nr:hypothetical protein L596_030642 [Steinernema carpocapsae]